jgi:hypothetical protein
LKFQFKNLLLELLKKLRFLFLNRGVVMSLILTFYPSDKVLIGPDAFSLVTTAPALVTSDGQVITVTDDDARLSPGVSVRLAAVQPDVGVRLAFTAPSNVLIQRVKPQPDEGVVP